MTKIDGFIIYPTYRIEDGKSYVYLFGRLKDGKSFCTKNSFDPYFFIKKEDLTKAKKISGFEMEDSELKSFSEEELVKIKKSIPKEVGDLRKEFEEKGIDCFEADIRFAYRFMMDYDLKGTIKIDGKESKNDAIRVDTFFNEPKLEAGNWRPQQNDLRILSIDLEQSMDGKDFYCLSMVSNDKKLNKVLIISKDKSLKHSELFNTEKELLSRFREYIIEYDPDVVTGWNLIDFDLKVLEQRMKRLGINFDLGRTTDEASLRIFDSFITDSKAEFPGRMVLDGIHVLKTSFIRLPDYKLETAAEEFSKEKKLIKGDNRGDQIEEAYKKNQQRLVDYNLLDSRLVLEIIKNSGGLQLTIHRSLLTGMPLDRVRASIASLDSLYLRKLRKKGYVALSSKYTERTERTTGGYVMDPKPGIYSYIIVCDFKSLYPSIMRTFNIDPLMFRPGCKKIGKEDLIKAPNGACFSKKEGILPSILQEMWKERESARKNKDELTRWAIKILMNSMYGVLASPNCRFYNFDIANSITGFAHKIIKLTAKRIGDKGYEVIYGDTDSVFVNLGVNSEKEASRLGQEIQKEINEHFTKMIPKEYGVKSFLELEFEKIFKKFLMPKGRGSEAGAKKRYAGLTVKDGKEKMEFTGLEFVRRDWTALSKKFQLEMLDLIFHEKEITSYVKKFVTDLKKGKYDDLLVYRKALRKNVDEYVKTTPPHVKAARKLEKITSNIIDYVMTSDGPEPIQKIEHSIDYKHYIEKQIKPIADSVLVFFNQEFDDVVEGTQQKSLFSFS